MAPDQIEPATGPLRLFADRLPAPGMRRMYADWLARRNGAAMPRRTDFDPLRFPELIPSVQLHERLPGGRYFCRVSGGDIVAAFGYESTGRHLDEVIPPEHLASRLALFNRSLDDALPLLYEGRLVIAAREWKRFQRLLLPYADTGGLPRFVVSILHFAALQAVDRPASTDQHGLGQVAWPTPGELAAIS